MDEQNEQSNYKCLEDDFMNDLKQTQRIVLLLGMKGSGKTVFLLSYLKYALMYNQYESYHLVLPSYKFEQSGAYKFLENQYQCYIYPSYTAQVSKRVLDDRKKGLKTLFMIDDGSGFNLNDEHFKTIVTTSRHGQSKKHEHGGICVFLAIHSARRVMLPIIRQNADYIFIFQMNNRKLLESLHEEYFSMFYDKFIQFLNVYKESMKTKYNALLYSNQNAEIDINVVDWALTKEMQTIKELPKQGKPKTRATTNEKNKNETVKDAHKQKISELFKPVKFNHGIRK